MKIKMKAGLSGPEFSLAPGDTKVFEDANEAQRLIDAGFAELAKDDAVPAISETLTERVARLKAELKEADAALKAETAAAKATKPAAQA